MSLDLYMTVVGYSSMVQHLPDACKALSLVHSNIPPKKKREKKLHCIVCICIDYSYAFNIHSLIFFLNSEVNMEKNLKIYQKFAIVKKIKC